MAALFGTDMVDVTTPDGRRVTMPSQLASQFPALSIGQPPGGAPAGTELAAPPPLPGPSAAPSWSAGDTSGLAALTPPPTPNPPVPPPTDGPVTTPAQTASTGATQRVAGPVTSPAQSDSAAARDPSAIAPTPPPELTNAGLAKLGNAGAANLENAALDQKGAAVREAARVDADQATAVGNFMAQRDAETQRLLAERAKQALENQQALAAKQMEYERAATEIANTKIDRSIDHPILAAISVVLGGIGSAMRRESVNPAMDALYKAIDRKVDGQMQDLANRRANLGIQRDAIGMQREMGNDALATMDQYRLGYLDQAQRQIETIKAQSGSDRAKANADLAIAGIQQEKATTIGNAMAREQAKIAAEQARRDAAAQHAAAMALTRRGQDLEQKRFEDTQAWQQKKEILDLEYKYKAEGDKANAERAKLVRQNGITDPLTGDVLLTDQGKQKMQQADKLEAMSRREQDPAKQQAQAQQAQQLRESAQLNDAIVAPDEKRAEKIQSVLVGTANIVKGIKTASSILSGDPAAWDREDWARAKVALEGVKAFYASTLGEKLSPRAIEAFDTITGIDPDSITSRVVDKGPALAALKELEQQVTASADTSLKVAGFKQGWNPALALDPKANAEVEIGKGDRSGPTAGQRAALDKFGLWGVGARGGQTADEARQAAEPGLLQQIGGRIINPIGGYDSFGAQGEAEENSLGDPGKRGAPSNYGLDPADDSKVRAQIKAANSANNAKYSQILDSLAQPLLRDDRPSLIRGVGSLIRDSDPKLYTDLLNHIATSKDGGVLKARQIAALTVPPSLGGPVREVPEDQLDDQEKAALLEARAKTADAQARANGARATAQPPQLPPDSIWQKMNPSQRAIYVDGMRKRGVDLSQFLVNTPESR